MDRGIIEEKGIYAVSEYLTDIGYIKPYLSSNDKTPMWDGSLFVYKSKDDFNKERFDYHLFSVLRYVKQMFSFWGF